MKLLEIIFIIEIALSKTKIPHQFTYVGTYKCI